MGSGDLENDVVDKIDECIVGHHYDTLNWILLINILEMTNKPSDKMRAKLIAIVRTLELAGTLMKSYRDDYNIMN